MDESNRTTLGYVLMIFGRVVHLGGQRQGAQ